MHQAIGTRKHKQIQLLEIISLSQLLLIELLVQASRLEFVLNVSTKPKVLSTLARDNAYLLCPTEPAS